MKVSIRPVVKNGKRVWCVDHRNGPERKRTFWPSKATAKQEASRIKDEVGKAWAEIPDPARDRMARLMEEAAEAGTSLEKVFAQWKAGPFQETEVPTKTLGELVAECVAAKRAAGCREIYLTNLRQCLTAFIRGRETMPVASIGLAEVEDWMAQKSGTGWTRSMWRSRISTLFSFAVRRGYLQRNPVDRVESVRIESKVPAIFTVTQCGQLMKDVAANHPRALAWFTLALFAGIRPGECDRLRWQDVDLKGAVVRIEAAASKVRQRRIVPLEPVAVAWLKKAQKLGADLPLPAVTRRRALRAVRGTLGLKAWPADVLRHTAASCLLAHHQDAGKVALWLGNSASVLFRHYREIVTKEEAEKWLKLRP